MDELPKNDFLTQEQYEKYLELYLLNKSNLNDTKNKICVNCQGGSVEVIEDTKTLLLNCNNEGCYHFRIKLPTYYLFDDSVELIKNSDKSKSIKDKNIKKLQDKYDLINNTDQKKRDLERNSAKIELFGSDYKEFNDKLKQESANMKFYIQHLTEDWLDKVNVIKVKVDPIVNEIARLKDIRQAKSASLQQQLFEQYNFLNANGDIKSLRGSFFLLFPIE